MNMCKCKIEFLVAPGGPCDPARLAVAAGAPMRAVEVWSTGKTCAMWADELKAQFRSMPSAAHIEIKQVLWTPAMPVAPTSVESLDSDLDATAISVPADCSLRAVRLFAFGMEATRKRVRQAITDWDDKFDCFVA